MTELESLLILNNISGLGNARIRRLLEIFGSGQNVLAQSRREFDRCDFLPKKVIESIKNYAQVTDVKEELALIEKHQIKVFTLADQDYPSNLKEIPDAPVLFYVKGTLLPQDQLAVSIVGSRRSSVYGLTMAEKLAIGLAEVGITVISGMARGIDTAAHRGALKVKGRTIAVLGSGLLNIYPPENKKLYEEISSSGAVISEFPLKTDPLVCNFPRRNRIVSGLSLGVVVVEASLKSGALITSRFALEQGREVFAVPGKVDNPTAQGVNNLIKQGAKLISGVEDILEELSPQLKNHLKESQKTVCKSAQNLFTAKLSEKENKTYNTLTDTPKPIDEIVDLSGLSASEVLESLLNLEFKKIVRQLPGKRFQKV